jgi:imidazole glycerol-phosphate synthase subunit HisF
VLKKRVAATLVVKDGIVVQSINFKRYLPVGKPAIAVEFLTTWGIDEIILLDMSATAQKRAPNYKMIKMAATKCYVPLTVGGGITSIEHIKELMHCGADKIALNQAAIHKPELITEAALIFGNQCVVISIDVVKSGNNYNVYDYLTKKILPISPVEMAIKVQELGAGEIMVNSVDRDGAYTGYDIDLINAICQVATVPVICCGGAKNAQDFIEVFSKTPVNAASAANFFHFSEHSVNITKSIVNHKIDVRLETHADYHDSTFDGNLRLMKKEDTILEDMLFIKIEKEVI